MDVAKRHLWNSMIQLSWGRLSRADCRQRLTRAAVHALPSGEARVHCIFGRLPAGGYACWTINYLVADS